MAIHVHVHRRGRDTAPEYTAEAELNQATKKWHPVVCKGGRKVWIGTQQYPSQAEAETFAKTQFPKADR